MTTMLRTTAIVSILAVSGLALATTFAQDGPPPGAPGAHRRGPGPGGPDGFGGPGGPGGPMGGPMGLLGELGPGLRALELTDAQREQIRGIAKTHEAEFREIGDRLRTAHESVNALVTADTVDEAAIRARSGELSVVEADAAVMRARVHQEVFSVLTAEQQAKAKELRAQMQERSKQRMEYRKERRPGRENRL
jgi:Spy/CpxP family protein refolding chaperone